MEVKEGKTHLTEIPHEGSKIAFQHPSFRGDYGSVAEQIDEAGLRRPSSAKTASLVYDAFQNQDGKYESETIKILNDQWFWEFTGNLYLPKSNQKINNGVILDLNPEIANRKLVMEKGSLIKRLKENDSSVKFVPFGYKIGKQNSFELMKNPYIVARYGEEGAEKIAEIASKYKENPHLWSFNSVDEELVRMSAVGSDWYFDDRLEVSGNDWGVDGDGLSFGVCL